MAVIVASSGGDDTAALQAAATAGQSIYLPDSVYRISGTVVLPERVDIKGAGRNVTALTMLPGMDTAFGMLCCRNGGWNEISNLSFIGNGVSSLSDGVGAVSVHMDPAATTAMGSVSVHDCRLSGFQNDNWILARNDGSFAIGTVTVENNEFLSVMGNSRFYDYQPDVMAAFIQAWGSAANPQGSIAKLVIRRNYFDGTGIAGAAVKSWQNVLETVCDDNEFLDVCQGITALVNAYVVLFYTQGGTPNGGGSFCNNKVRNRYGLIGPGCALYAANTGPVIANANRISGVLRSDNQLLRRAALSFNGVRQVTVVGNQITGCATGVALCGSAAYLTYGADSSHLIACNNIYSDAGSSVGLNVSWNDAGTAAPKVGLLRNLVKVAGTPVIAMPGSYGSLTNDTV